MPIRRNTSRRQQSRRQKPVAKRSLPAKPRRSVPVSRQTVEAKPVAPSPVTRQTVAETAYFLWLQRGGDATTNWIEAERMLAAQAI